MTTNTLVAGEYEIWRNSQWRVTNKFLEEVADPALAGPPYWIAFADLQRSGTVEHVCSKTWVNAELFVEAYRKAAEIIGFQPDEPEIVRALDPQPDEITATIRELIG